MFALKRGYVALMLLSVLSLTTQNQLKNNWAVIVAGSNGYTNYRHQADAAHAYHMFRQRGFDPNKIILMMFNDVPDWSENPYPGKLFNNYSHIDVYAGLDIQYQQEMVSAETMVKMMTGDVELKARGHRVLESTGDDNVFFNFADHGGPGILCFPGDDLMVVDFIGMLHKMHNKTMYKQMVLYIEACESGSMFKGQNLPPNVYVNTAASPDESSWACLYDDHLETFLGDCYSLNWMNDTEIFDDENRTLAQQYEAVRALTVDSHVQMYGQKNISTEYLSNFQGYVKRNDKLSVKQNLQENQHLEPLPMHRAHLGRHFYSLKHSQDPTKRAQAQAAIDKADAEEAAIKKMFDKMTEDFLKTKSVLSLNMRRERISHMINRPFDYLKISDAITSCYTTAARAFFKGCFRIPERPALHLHLHKLLNMCQLSLGNDPRDILHIVQATCSNQ